ncbi:SDR family oxidoreductase [Amycolatopsis sp. GM8]|uniref:SDR family NAD(P)-dependent oxidoreductase n=1 Tax=Amycolatopsis sp. GM8 TaxID=2896530 RepID=UPI001F17C158|nr:SDR family NAD(P)-dependent oxidoreductase [Amycolatopsis sp. GM8]
MPTLAIFGAGPGRGLATARRFGREGFDIALVARSPDRLESFVDELVADGIKAEGLAADLSDRSGHAELVDQIGPVDVAVVNAYVGHESIRPVQDIDVESMRRGLDGTVLAPLSLTRLLLPHMRAQGNGAVIYGLGAPARHPVASLAGSGAAQASLRNYALALNQELAGQGVYIGVLTIGALVRHSDAEKVFDTDPAARRGFEPERVEPAYLADETWAMYTRREAAEHTVGQLAA